MAQAQDSTERFFPDERLRSRRSGVNYFVAESGPFYDERMRADVIRVQALDGRFAGRRVLLRVTDAERVTDDPK